MALQWLWKNVMGECTITQEKKDENGNVTSHNYKLTIYAGNCLCIFMASYIDKDTGERMYYPYMFFADLQHLKNVIKNHDGDLFGGGTKVKGIKLNLFFKDAERMLPILVKGCGIKVTAYYKEIK